MASEASRTVEVITHTRADERVASQVPVVLESGTVGLTRNVSPRGVYFTIDDVLLAEGQLIRFTLEFDQAGDVLQLDCEARVVRVERLDETIGVGAKIVASRLKRVSAEDSPTAA